MTYIDDPRLDSFIVYARAVIQQNRAIRIPRWVLGSNGKNYNLWALVTAWSGRNVSNLRFIETLVEQGSAALSGGSEVMSKESLLSWAPTGYDEFTPSNPLDVYCDRVHQVLRGRGEFSINNDTHRTSFQKGDTFVVPNSVCREPVVSTLRGPFNLHIVTYWGPKTMPKTWTLS